MWKVWIFILILISNKICFNIKCYLFSWLRIYHEYVAEYNPFKLSFNLNKKLKKTDNNEKLMSHDHLSLLDRLNHNIVVIFGGQKHRKSRK